MDDINAQVWDVTEIPPPAMKLINLYNAQEDAWFAQVIMPGTPVDALIRLHITKWCNIIAATGEVV